MAQHFMARQTVASAGERSHACVVHSVAPTYQALVAYKGVRMYGNVVRSWSPMHLANTCSVVLSLFVSVYWGFHQSGRSNSAIAEQKHDVSLEMHQDVM